MSKKINFSKIGLMVLGVVLMIGSSLVEDKKQENMIHDEVEKQLSEKSEEGE